jgi:hypothetical protein
VKGKSCLFSAKKKCIECLDSGQTSLFAGFIARRTELIQMKFVTQGFTPKRSGQFDIGSYPLSITSALQEEVHIKSKVK